MNCKPVIKKSSRHKSNDCSTSAIEVTTRNWQKVSPEFTTKLPNLETILSKNDKLLYAYVLTSVEYDDNEDKFLQYGCSPNFEGGVGTLCCCKHKMRTYPKVEENTWIAGFTCSNGSGKNYLYYLAKISKTPDTYPDLAILLEEKVSRVKDVRNNKLGDLYVMKKGREKRHYKLGDYHESCNDHVHWKNGKLDSWEQDINYQLNGNHHKLLIFDKKHTYVWENPEYHSKALIGIGERKFESSIDFINSLKLCKK